MNPMPFVSVGLSLAALCALAVRRPRTPHPFSPGSARWATKRGLKRARLLLNAGVYVGEWPNGEYLRSGADKHVLVGAPPGSGKTVGLVIPTLLSWTESVFCLDLKGE